MAGDKRGILTELSIMSRALREVILDATEDDLDEAITGAGDDPETLAGKARAVVGSALAEYWSEEVLYRAGRQSQSNTRGGELG